MSGRRDLYSTNLLAGELLHHQARYHLARKRVSVSCRWCCRFDMVTALLRAWYRLYLISFLMCSKLGPVLTICRILSMTRSGIDAYRSGWFDRRMRNWMFRAHRLILSFQSCPLEFSCGSEGPECHFPTSSLRDLARAGSRSLAVSVLTMNGNLR